MTGCSTCKERKLELMTWNRKSTKDKNYETLKFLFQAQQREQKPRRL